MATAVLRKEIHSIIDAIPERRLSALKPLLPVLAEPLYIIEPATKAETMKAEKRIKEYHENPESFVPWKRKIYK